jgi:lysophospholipase L1-like esterase
VLGGVAAVILSTAPRAQDQASQHWVGTWATSASFRVDPPAGTPPAPAATPDPDDLPPAVVRAAPSQKLAVAGQSPLHFHNQTLRQIAHISIGGRQLRVVLTNVFGTVPLRVGAAHVALRLRDAEVVPASVRPLTFGGSPSTVISAGAVALSDTVDLTVPDFADLAIDLYLPQDTATMGSPITMHPAAWQTNYVSPAGNFSGAATLPVQTTTAHRRTDGLPSASSFFLSRIEVLAPSSVGAVVALGDSITDGTYSGTDTNNRWPDHLARRLLDAGIRMGVLNAGIGGNRILNDGNGPNGLARYDRDVLAQTGVTHVIVLEGINDIGQGRSTPTPSVADLIAAHRQLIDRAHARGLTIYGATLTPFEGANYWTPEGEAKRQALNDWIRTSKAYDAWFDFDAVIRDPAHQTKARSAFDPGDHLHLTPAGYKTAAEAIELSLFRR